MKLDGRKYVLFIASCIVCVFGVCITITIGTTFLSLLDTFKESRAATATIQSMFIGVATCCSIVSGLLIKKQGVTRISAVGTFLFSGGFVFSSFATSILVLNILICVLAGFGVSFLFISATAVVRNSFHGRSREIALSTLQVAMGFGTLLYPLLLEALVNKYGVHGMFLILGGLYLNNIVFTILTYENDHIFSSQIESREPRTNNIMETRDSAVSSDGNISRKSSMSKLLRKLVRHIILLMDFRYITVLVAGGLVISSGNSYLVVMIDILTWKGISPDQFLSIRISFYSSAICGRALPIAFSMAKPGNDLIALLMFCFVCGCLGQILLLLPSTMTVMFAANVLAGVTQGCIVSAATVSIANTSTNELFGVALGLFLTVNGALSSAGGPLYGFIRDSEESYQLAIVLMAVLNGFSVLMFSFVLVRKACKSRKQSVTVSAATL